MSRQTDPTKEVQKQELENKARKQGYQAFSEGLLVSPYTKSRYKNAWYAGWLQAKHDSQIKM